MALVTPEFTPPDTDLREETVTLVGLMLACVAYGILATIFLQCMLQFEQVKARSFWIPYFNIVIFVLATVGIGCAIKQVQMTFVDYRNFPGGPNLFSYAFYNTPINVTSLISSVLISVFADGLMVYRFMAIYSSKRWLACLPLAAYLAYIAASVYLTLNITQPRETFNWGTNFTSSFGVSFWPLSIVPDLGITIAIVAQLWSVRSRLRSLLGSRHIALYTSVTVVLIESNGLYSAWALANVILYAKANVMQILVLGPLWQIKGIACLLINFRVGQGTAWDKDTLTARETRNEGSWGEPITFRATPDS